MKKRESTADKLLHYRERLAQHYKSLRSERCKPVPKPQAVEFAPQYRSFCEKIEAEELAKHEAALKRIKETGA